MTVTDDLEARVARTLRHVAELPPGSVEPAAPTGAETPPRAVLAGRGRLVIVLAAVTVVVVATVAARLVYQHHGVDVATEPGQAAGPTGAAVTLPGVDAPSGSTALDYGLLRVYLPRGWTSIRRCAASAELFYLVPDTALASPPLGCPPSLAGWASIQPFTGAAPDDWRAATVNATVVWSHQVGGQEIVAIPSLHAQITAVGAGRAILATVGPSSLAAVLALRHPITVPRSWKAVRFAGLQIAVPADWPIAALTGQLPEPGVCTGPIFQTATVYLGADGFRPLCAPTVAQLDPPVDGAWLAAPTSNQQANIQTMALGPLLVSVEYSDPDTDAAIAVRVTVDAQTVNLVVGLGVDPTVAEGILSSLRTSPLPPSTATPTTPPGPDTPTTSAP